MKLLLLTILIIFSINSNGQKTYKVKKQQKDLKILKETLLNHTGNPYLYTDSLTFESKFNEAKNKLNKELNQRELFLVISELTSLVRCGHTSSFPSKKLFREFFRKKVIPIHFTTLNGNIYASKTFGKKVKIQKHSRILEINGETDIQILNNLYKHISSDGYNTTFKSEFLSLFFNVYHYFYYGSQKEYKIKAIVGKDTLTTTIESAYPNTSEYRKHFTKSIFNTKKKEKDYGKVKINTEKNYAVLKYKSFKEGGKRKYNKKLYSHFKRINKSNVDYLVIDLRDNLGGIPQQLLAGFLVDSLSSMGYKKMKNIEKPKYKRHFKRWNKYYLKYLFDRFIAKFYNKRKKSFKIELSASPFITGFKCDKKVIVLVNGNTFSASPHLAANLKEHSNAVIIGQETGGSYKHLNTGQLQLKLPCSNFLIGINPFYCDNGVEFEDGNSGLKPDIYVKDKLKYSSKNDPYFKAVEKYINEQKVTD